MRAGTRIHNPQPNTRPVPKPRVSSAPKPSLPRLDSWRPKPQMASPAPSPPFPKKQKMSTATSSSDPEPESAAAAAAEPKVRYKRRKVAIFIAYCGFGYQGMQKNPGARTIESDLEEALFLSGAVPESDKCNPKRYDWARSARTDKGVSAAGQVVSGRFYIDPPGFVERMNSNLSEQIRVFGFSRVTNSFNAKKFCDRRRYVYLLPVFALDPNAHPDRESVMKSVGSGNELVKCVECSERGRKVVGVMGRSFRFSKEEERSELESGNGGFNVKIEKAELGDSSVSKEEERREVEAGHGRVSEKTELSSVKSELGDSGVSKEEEKIELVDFNSNAEGRSEAEIGVSAVDCDSKISQDDESSSRLNEQGALLETSVLNKELGVNVTNGEQIVGLSGSKFEYGGKERERFNGILKRYVGTHNFHNFTTRTKAEDPSARRYIISFNADRVVSLEGLEFVRCEVVGQSFMLHQIRKMIGLAVAMMRNCCPESLMDIALRQDININVPTAPEVGLYLDECFFTSYNQKWKDSHEALSMDAYAEQAEEFKLKHIFSHIASMEHKEGAVALWLHSLNHRNYPDFRFQESNGRSANAEHAEVDKMAD